MNNKGRSTAAALIFCLLGAFFSGIGAKASTDSLDNQNSLYALASPTDNGSTEAASEASADVIIGSRIWELLGGGEEKAVKTSSARQTLIVGGTIFGTRIKEARVSVASCDEDSSFKEGDKIISINGKDIYSINDIKDALRGYSGGVFSVTVERGGRRIALSCTPKQVGKDYRLGAVLREGAAGIGTITYIDPKTGEFGGLGHGICDPESGKVIEMSGGVVTDVILGGIKKGEAGTPGELSGILTDHPHGEITSNTDCGIFGKLNTVPTENSITLPIAYRNEVHAGEAKIISTLKNGYTAEYKIEISDVKPSQLGTKCFKIHVKDNALIAISGGIVRGMSGSPIIQDGKLVGAVTHVMIDDPTSGYGIFIENMLNASASTRNELPKAA
ncbi:MAG: SpoIVB peptidase [Clostridia bacterium]|nr:SpoIVB peptidase [Clostridia bacterium]